MGVTIGAGFALASFGGTVAGDPDLVYWTIGFSVSGPPDVDAPDDLFAAWVDNFAPCTSTDFTFQGVKIKYGPNDTGPVYESSAAGGTGAVGESMVPLNTAALVRKTTGTGGRQGRGRAYMCGCVLQGAIGGAGLLDSGQRTAIQTACDGFYGDANDVANVDQLVLLHSDADIPSTIIALTCQPYVATQRRRLRP